MLLDSHDVTAAAGVIHLAVHALLFLQQRVFQAGCEAVHGQRPGNKVAASEVAVVVVAYWCLVEVGVHCAAMHCIVVVLSCELDRVVRVLRSVLVQICCSNSGEVACRG